MCFPAAAASPRRSLTRAKSRLLNQQRWGLATQPKFMGFIHLEDPFVPRKGPSPASGYNPVLGDFYFFFSSWKYDPAPKLILGSSRYSLRRIYCIVVSRAWHLWGTQGENCCSDTGQNPQSHPKTGIYFLQDTVQQVPGADPYLPEPAFMMGKHSKLQFLLYTHQTSTVISATVGSESSPEPQN